MFILTLQSLNSLLFPVATWYSDPGFFVCVPFTGEGGQDEGQGDPED